MLSPKLLFFFFGTIAGILSTLILIPEVQTHAYSASNRLSGFLHGGGGEEEERSGSAWKPPEFDVGDYGGVPVGTESVVCTRREKELLRGKVGDKLVGESQRGFHGREGGKEGRAQHWEGRLLLPSELKQTRERYPIRFRYLVEALVCSDGIRNPASKEGRERKLTFSTPSFFVQTRSTPASSLLPHSWERSRSHQPG